MVTVPVDEQLTPTTMALAAEDVARIKFVPLTPPIILPVAVPTLKLPVVMFMPQITPFAVLALLEVVRVMAVIVFPCIVQGVGVTAAISMAINLVATVETIANTPV